MPMNSDTPEGMRATESEGAMFAPTPIWAQDPKARRRARTAAGRRQADRAETDPAMDAGEAGAGAGVMGATTAAEPADPAYETQPARSVRRGGVSPAVIAAGVAVAAIAAGASWYAMSRPSDHGLAQLTPGQAAATAAPPTANQLPITRVSDSGPVADPATPQSSDRTPVRRRGSHARPASAMDSSVNASATVHESQQTDAPAPVVPPTATTTLSPLSGTTSPVPPASTPSASSAEPGASPAATPGPITTP